MNKYQDQEGVGNMLGGAAIPPSTGNRRQTIEEVLQKESMNQACRQSLFDSLVSRIHRAESNANEAARLRRLAELFDKHPEVREMFELIRDTGLL